MGKINERLHNEAHSTSSDGLAATKAELNTIFEHVVRRVTATGNAPAEDLPPNQVIRAYLKGCCDAVSESSGQGVSGEDDEVSEGLVNRFYEKYAQKPDTLESAGNE